MATRKNTAKDCALVWLKSQGITTSRSKVGLNFHIEGWTFLLWHDADDPYFFRLTLPGIFDVTDENYAEALMACNTINWNYKVVKASLYEFEEAGRRRASVWVCFEQLLNDTDAVDNGLMERAVATLTAAAEHFQNLISQ